MRYLKNVYSARVAVRDTNGAVVFVNPDQIVEVHDDFGKAPPSPDALGRTHTGRRGVGRDNDRYFKEVDYAAFHNATPENRLQADPDQLNTADGVKYAEPNEQLDKQGKKLPDVKGNVLK